MLGQIAAGGAAVAGYRDGGSWGSLYFLVACIVSWFSWSVPIAVTLLLIVPSIMWPISALFNGRYFFGISLLIISFVVNMFMIPYTWGLL